MPYPALPWPFEGRVFGMPAPTPAAAEKNRKRRFTPPADAPPVKEEPEDEPAVDEGKTAKADEKDFDEWFESDDF